MVTTDKVTVAEFAPHIGKTTTDYKENDMGVGVYIPNMSKPKNCSECILADKHLNGLYEAKYYCRLEADNCPLIEIATCGECEWYDKDFKDCNIRDSYGWEYKPTDFCSYGERKEGE